MRILTTFLLLYLVATTAVHAEEWYEGGTLHGSTLDEWQQASERNKIATSADWIVTVLGSDEVVKIGFDGLRVKAVILTNCVDELAGVAAENFDPSTSKSNSLGLLCITTFEKNSWQ